MRHINIPVFIPHLGCPNLCVFCSQKSISGKKNLCEDTVLSDAEREIDRALETVEADDEVEIAFFGGSFTGIERSLMIGLLDIAEKRIKNGRVGCIRMSTRPDYISEDILDIIEKYSVKFIELGIQSMSGDVLEMSKRGHSVLDTEKACKMIKSRGFCLIGQMMTGLPGSTPEKEIFTAKRIIELGADGARIYPTMVFRHTELEKMMNDGRYIPPSEESIIKRTADVLEVFLKAGVPVIKIGLHSGEELYGDDGIVNDSYSPATGEKVMSRVMLGRIEKAISESAMEGTVLLLSVAKGFTSKTIGQNKSNKLYLCRKYGFSDVRVKEDTSLPSYSFNYEIRGKKLET